MACLELRVFDVVRGLPAEGMRADLLLYRLARSPVEIARRRSKTETLWSYRLIKSKPVHIAEVTTDEDGRAGEPLLAGESLIAGHYALVLHVRKYYEALQMSFVRPVMFEPVQIMFAVTDEDSDYLLDVSVSPYMYTARQGP